MIAGVAGGLADYIGVDPSVVRTTWVVLAILTGGILVVPYGVMWLVVPDETDDGDESAEPGTEARSQGRSRDPRAFPRTRSGSERQRGGL